MRVDVFPALFTGFVRGESGETLLVESESSCFYHPKKKAVVPCENCGRFLCALCDVDLNGQHLCPACIETGKKKQKITSLDNHRVLYDSIAVHLAVLPVIFMWPFTIVTAPIALFVAIRYWKAPLSIIRRTKIRYVAAIIFASLQVAGWTALIISSLSA